MVQLVLFDIDGTLIESGGAGVNAFARVCATEFKVPNGTAGLRFAGRTDPAIIREFFQRNQIEPSDKNFHRFYDCYVFWLDHLLSQTGGRVLPGVTELIARLQTMPEPPVIGLLTGNIRLGAQIKLTHYDLWKHFVTGGFGDDHENRSQIAAIARDRGNALLKRELRGEEILVIGDTPLDIACARAINAKILAVATGSYPLDNLHQAAPDWAVANLMQVCVEEVCGR